MDSDASRPSRPKILFLSLNYPSSSGSGIQLRAAALVRMLATHADVYVLVLWHVEKLTGPPDPEMEALCRKVVYLRVQPTELFGLWYPLESASNFADIPVIDCLKGETAERVVRFYEENRLDSLFIFCFPIVSYIHTRLDSFPDRVVDVHELPSTSEEELQRLCPERRPANHERKMMDAKGRLLEKAAIPRFRRVFVASPVEAEHVRQRTGFQHSEILPNVLPVLTTALEKLVTAQAEMLFVGSLFYPPNIDAVLYFCREILPLIREKKGDSVLFRVVGMGDPTPLRCLEGQPGFAFMGHQECLDPFYARASVIVVPLRAGNGTRIKIIEAFARRRPVVSTFIGAEGLAVTNRKNILLADDPGTFAQACLELIDNPSLAGAICEEAALLQRDHYSPDALLRCYENGGRGELCATASQPKAKR